MHTYDDTVQDSGNALDRHFCAKCATPLYNSRGDFGKTLAVFYSALDDFNIDEKGEKSEKAPKVEYYAKGRAGWVQPVDGAVQAKTKPGRDD